MREELDKKIDNLLELIDQDSRIKEIDSLKISLLNNKDLINKIEKLKDLDKYILEYKNF